MSFLRYFASGVNFNKFLFSHFFRIQPIISLNKTISAYSANWKISNKFWLNKIQFVCDRYKYYWQKLGERWAIRTETGHWEVATVENRLEILEIRWDFFFFLDKWNIFMLNFQFKILINRDKVWPSNLINFFIR